MLWTQLIKDDTRVKNSNFANFAFLSDVLFRKLVTQLKGFVLLFTNHMTLKKTSLFYELFLT